MSPESSAARSRACRSATSVASRALGASADLQLRWEGAELDRLVDARRATLQNAVASLLAAGGWTVRPEVSFNHYGDRGRVDLLAYHLSLGIVLIVEIKSALGDLQETLGRMDVKLRLAPTLVRQAGWPDATAAVPALVIGDSRAARRIVDAHAALLRGFPMRGRGASAWLRRPHPPAPRGLLWFAGFANGRGCALSTRRGQGSVLMLTGRESGRFEARFAAVMSGSGALAK